MSNRWVIERCQATKGVSPSRLAASDEEICGRPARWGILTAWTCDEHRRECDQDEIGEEGVRAAFRLLEQMRSDALRART